MKRLPDSTHLYASVHESRVFRDDLEGILELLRQAGLRTELVSGQYSFDSLDELHSHVGTRPTGLEICGYSEDSTWRAVQIEVEGRRLTLSGDTDRLGPAGYRLRDHILSLHFSPLYLRFWTWWLAGVALTVVDLMLPKVTAAWRNVIEWAPLASYGIAFGTYLARRQFGGVRLTRRHEGGFFKRNSNAIGLLIIGAALGAILTGIVTMLTSK